MSWSSMAPATSSIARAFPASPAPSSRPSRSIPAIPSRDIAWVPNTDQGPVLASVDADDNAISLYAWRERRLRPARGSLTTGQLPAQIIAADLNGTGMTDLVVRNAGDGTLVGLTSSNHLGQLSRSGRSSALLLLAPVTIPVGLGVSDVEAVDTTGDGRLDLVVTNKLTGQVSVLLQPGQRPFAAPVPYRAGTGSVRDRPRQLARGHEPRGDGGRGRRTAHARRSNRPRDHQPRLEHTRHARRPGRRPVRQSRTIQTASPAQVVRMGDFTGNGIDDLAVLDRRGLTIYLATAREASCSPTTYAVPPNPTA